eukprot:COSAG06_NODE_34835_length_468_cov_1.745257_1_plen_79_part_01
MAFAAATQPLAGGFHHGTGAAQEGGRCRAPAGRKRVKRPGLGLTRLRHRVGGRWLSAQPQRPHTNRIPHESSVRDPLSR